MLEKLSNLLDILADGAIAFFVFILFVMIGLGIWEGISKLIKSFRRKKNKENEDTENTDNTSNTEDAKLKDLITRYLSLEPLKISEYDFFQRGCEDIIYHLVQIKSNEDIELILELHNYIYYKNCGKFPSDFIQEIVLKTCFDSLGNKTKIVIEIEDISKLEKDEYFTFDILFTMKEFKEHLSKFE